jgi:type IV pilus assembly protein PilB
MFPAQDLKLADVLLADKVINQAQYDEVKLENLNTGVSVEEILKKHNLASDEAIVKAKAKIYNIPFVNLVEVGTSPEALNLISKLVAERYHVFPFALNKEKGIISLAMVNPLDLTAINFLEEKSAKKIAPYFATEDAITQAIEEKYSQSLSSEVTAALKETSREEGTKVIDVAKIGEVIREAPIAKIVITLLEFAIKARASDIHIEPLEDKTRVRYRIDGILHEKLILPKTVHEAVVSRIKILSGMKIDEKRIPQDGRFTFRAGEEVVDLRISTLPSVHGEKIVMRLLKKTGKVPTLPQLGLRGLALKNLEQAVLVPHGIILITGPTGSGKTTTLYSILSKINTPKVNIITIEDPVEYEIVGVNQVQINPAAGLTFASGLRSFLRQDPNIIMVGEVRDQETADLAIQAALTGHLVFSTLHTNEAAGALPRLLDMHMEPYLLASSMTCVVAQRVVRCLCTNCKEQYTPSGEVEENIKQILGKLYNPPQGGLKLYKGRGCPNCNDTGYLGRIGIFEVLPISEKIGRLILERAPSTEIAKMAVAEGMMTMKQDGYLKALEGITTVEEVIRVAEI